jgi:hypothetical protein
MIVTAPRPPSAGVDLGAIFARAWSLLRANPVIVMLLVAVTVTAIAVLSIFVFVGVVVLLRVSGSSSTSASNALSTVVPAVTFPFFVFWCAGILIQFGVYAALYGLVNAVWTRGTGTVADAWTAARTRSVQIFVATIGLVGLGIGAAIIALPTLFVSMLALPLFTMFTFPAVIAGRDGFAALGESLRTVRRHFGTSAIATLILFAIQYALSFVAYPFILPLQIAWIVDQPTGRHATFHVPPTSTIVLAIVGYLLVGALALISFGFTALVQTGIYHTLRARDEPGPPASDLAAIEER